MIDLRHIPTPDILAELKRRRDELNAVIAKASNPADIIEQVLTDEFKVDLRQTSQTQAVALPRQISMTLMRELGMPWAVAAGHFDMDHTNAMYAAKVVTLKEKTCTIFAAQMQAIRKRCAKALQTG